MYGLAGEGLEVAMYGIQALRDSMGSDLSRESVPNDITLLNLKQREPRHAVRY